MTTNFDHRFEQALSSINRDPPEVFRAPALPLGQRFEGIVHLHGCVTNPNETVLTDRDFGRAYLTENNGWAARFLVELFANFNILFIGYSHNDSIMEYLSRSLPPSGSNKRFSLAGQKEAPDRWKHYGIEPITFPQAGQNDYQSLHESIAKLVVHVQRGLLDWRHTISEAAQEAAPPIGNEAADTIEHALKDPIKTRFFTENASHPRRRDSDLFSHKEMPPIQIKNLGPPPSIQPLETDRDRKPAGHEALMPIRFLSVAMDIPPRPFIIITGDQQVPRNTRGTLGTPRVPLARPNI